MSNIITHIRYVQYATALSNVSGTTSSGYIGEEIADLSLYHFWGLSGSPSSHIGKQTITGEIIGDELHLHVVRENNYNYSVISPTIDEFDYVIKREGYQPIGIRHVVYGANGSEIYYTIRDYTDLSKPLVITCWDTGRSTQGYVTACYDADWKFTIKYGDREYVQKFNTGAHRNTMKLPGILKKDVLFKGLYTDETYTTPFTVDALSSRSDYKMVTNKHAYAWLEEKYQVPYSKDLPNLKNGLMPDQFGYRITDIAGWEKLNDLLTVKTNYVAGEYTKATYTDLKDYTIYLDNDLDFTDKTFTMIGSYHCSYAISSGVTGLSRHFSGIFDGRHHKIINPVINEQSASGERVNDGTVCYGYAPFRSVWGGVIKNFHVVNLSLETRHRFMAGICSHAAGGTQIYNCSASGEIKYTISSRADQITYVGGISCDSRNYNGYNVSYSYFHGDGSNGTAPGYVFNCINYTKIGIPYEYSNGGDDYSGISASQIVVNCANHGELKYRSTTQGNNAWLIADSAAYNSYATAQIVNSQKSSNKLNLANGSKANVWARTDYALNYTSGTKNILETEMKTLDEMRSKDFVDQLNQDASGLFINEADPWVRPKNGLDPIQNRTLETPTFLWAGGELLVPLTTSHDRYPSGSSNNVKLFTKTTKTDIEPYTPLSSSEREQWVKPDQTRIISPYATVTVYAFEGYDDSDIEFGAPCANARCWISKSYSGAIMSEAYTDETGHATLTYVPEGTYNLYVKAPIMDFMSRENIIINAGDTYHYDVYCFES